MNNPYLIQRATFKLNDQRSGIDSILSFDYMGSAEYEFGALYKSLTAIRKDIKDYDVFEVVIKGKTIQVYCKRDDIEDIERILNELSDNKHHCKEFHAFDKFIKGNDYFSDKFDCWWDIVNHYIWWKYDPGFTKSFKLLIQP